MAIGDTVIGHSSVANNASLTIHPVSGAEWIIYNIYMGGAWELHRTDGTNDILMKKGNTYGSLEQRTLKATNGIYYYIKNISGGAAVFGYDGVVWK